MTEPVAPLSRLYLIPTVIAAALGIGVLAAHLRQPDIPAFPGKGCIVTTFPSPDTSRIPAPHLELQACTHISETLLTLDYYASPEDGPSSLFHAVGPEDPRDWARYLRIEWPKAESILVRFDSVIRFEDRRPRHESVHIVYLPLDRPGG